MMTLPAKMAADSCIVKIEQRHSGYARASFAAKRESRGIVDMQHGAGQTAASVYFCMNRKKIEIMMKKLRQCGRKLPL
jgi:hypothetical protein